MKTSRIAATVVAVSAGLAGLALPVTAPPATARAADDQVVAWTGRMTITQDLTWDSGDSRWSIRGEATYTDIAPPLTEALDEHGSGQYAADVDVDWTQQVEARCDGVGPVQVVTENSFGWVGSSADVVDPDSGQLYVGGNVMRLRVDDDGAVYLTPWLASANAPQHYFCPNAPTGLRSATSAFGFLPGQSMEADVPLVDDDPDPDRLVGTTRFAAPAGRDFVTYRFDVTYDLRRETLDVEPCDHPSVTNRLYSTADGTSFLRAAAAPDPDLAAFGIGMRWCVRPDGAFVDQGLLTGAALSQNWVFLATLQELGFEPVQKDARVTSTETAVRGRGVFGVRTSPVEVVMTLPPTGRLLDRAATLLTKYGVWRKQGLSHAKAKERLRTLLQRRADRWERAVHDVLLGALDAVPGVSRRKARTWADILGGNVNQGVSDHFVDRLVDEAAGGQKLVERVFKRVFRRVVVPLWRVDVTLRTHPDGTARFEDRSRTLIVADEWTHGTTD